MKHKIYNMCIQWLFKFLLQKDLATVNETPKKDKGKEWNPKKRQRKICHKRVCQGRQMISPHQTLYYFRFLKSYLGTSTFQILNKPHSAMFYITYDVAKVRSSSWLVVMVFVKVNALFMQGFVHFHCQRIFFLAWQSEFNIAWTQERESGRISIPDYL